MDEKTIIEGLAYIGLAVGERLTDERTAVYVEQLRDLGNDHAWSQAVLDLAGHVSAFPKLPEIREAYRAAVARQPQRDALEEHKPTLEERQAQAARLREWMAEALPERAVTADMNSRGRIGPGGHIFGTKRVIPATMAYEEPEPPGGIRTRTIRPMTGRD